MRAATQACYAHCRDMVRRGDKDRFLSALFAPADRRDHLHALYAFNLEVARVRELVSDALPGEVRLQWWRDALNGEARGEIGRHPVAAALADTLESCALPTAGLHALVEARSCDLYDESLATLSDLESYVRDTSSTLLESAATILDPDLRNSTRTVALHGGIAYGLVGLLRALPPHAARGQVFIPEEVLARHGVGPNDIPSGRATPSLHAALAELRALAGRHMDEARAVSSGLSERTVAAFLPLALVGPYLGRMERAGYEPLRDDCTIAQWRRQWIIWRAACCAPRG